MSELTEKLWPAFRAEVVEQIEALELSLVGGQADSIQVNDVFRYMHTIKGGAAMMGFSAMEALAHAAEDLLDLVRRGQHAMDERIIDAMLATADALKQQLQEAERTRLDPPAQDELVGRLHDLAAASAAEKPHPAAAPTGRPRKRVATPATHVDMASSSPGQFPEEAERVLPALARSCAAGHVLPAAMTAGLAAVARQHDLPAMAMLLDSLCQADDRAARLSMLADLMGRLAGLETTTGTACGVEASARELRPLLAGDMQLAATVLHDLVQGMSAAMSASCLADMQEGLRPLLDAVLVMRDLALLLHLEQTAMLMRFVAQILRDVMRDMLPLTAELAELLDIASGLSLELVVDSREDAPYAAMCAQLVDRLKDQVLATGRDASRLARLAALQQKTRIDASTLEALTPRSLELLESAVAAGDAVVEIDADLEAADDAGEGFVAWLSAAGRIVSSTTIFSNGASVQEPTRLRFLVALAMPPEEIRLQLGRHDPDRRWLRLRHCDELPGSGDDAVAGAKPQVSQASGAAFAGGTLRIDSAMLDRFVSRVGEMVMLRNMLSHAIEDDDMTHRLRRLRRLAGQHLHGGARLQDQEVEQMHALLGDLEARFEQLEQADMRIQGAMGRLQEDVLGLRVVPVGVVFNRLPRVVRDLSLVQEKLVDFDMSGEDVRMDKGMVDILLEPLMHMVRNSVDHGIEQPAEREAAGKPARARLALTARQQGNSMLIEISDDGRGLDRERIRHKAIASGLITESEAVGMSDRELCNLIFLPGFSTSEQVTEVSGRGVGMDIVKTRVAQIGGQIDVESTPGAGARFTLRLPLSVAIQSVVLVATAGSQYALPERNVNEIFSIRRSQLQWIQGQVACLLRGVTLPVYHLGVLLGGAEADVAGDDALEIVVLSDGVYRIGILVDRVVGRPEVFVRDMHPDIARLPGIGGVSILGNGGVVIILDCERLFDLAVRNAQTLRSLLRVS